MLHIIKCHEVPGKIRPFDPSSRFVADDRMDKSNGVRGHFSITWIWYPIFYLTPCPPRMARKAEEGQTDATESIKLIRVSVITLWNHIRGHERFALRILRKLQRNGRSSRLTGYHIVEIFISRQPKAQSTFLRGRPLQCLILKIKHGLVDRDHYHRYWIYQDSWNSLRTKPSTRLGSCRSENYANSKLTYTNLS